MSQQIDSYRLLYFGANGSYSHDAAERARSEVVAYLRRTRNVSVPPPDLQVTGETHGPALEGLAKNGDARDFFVVPLCNSRDGDIHSFASFYAFKMITQIELPIVLVLCNLSGTREAIHLIRTKNSAFQQVKEVLKERGFDVEALNGSSDEISTSEGADEAAKNPSIAAICSPDTCSSRGLKPVGDILAERVTTFGVFISDSKLPFVPEPPLTQYLALMRNATLVPGLVLGGDRTEFANFLAERVNTKRPLRVKWGIDPISDTLHLGHLACLYKLQTFLAFGHEVIIVLGTFTGQIGDPSGNLTPRPRYDSECLGKNASAIRKQIECVLGSHENLSFESNADLLSSMDVPRLLRWGYALDYRLLTNRTEFHDRIRDKLPLSLAEMLYGLFQAYDTLMLNVDVEVGGLDQVHNGVLMRSILNLEKCFLAGRCFPTFVLLIDHVPGRDSQVKMSSFRCNEIRITDKQEHIKDQLISIRDAATTLKYMKLLTNLEESHIAALERAIVDKNLPKERLSEMMAEHVLRKLNPELQGLI